jgi:hypothetical protein
LGKQFNARPMAVKRGKGLNGVANLRSAFLNIIIFFYIGYGIQLSD